jgi:hypothetical protein
VHPGQTWPPHQQPFSSLSIVSSVGAVSSSLIAWPLPLRIEASLQTS